ncbi:MAG: hypothetical protein ACO1TE_08825 [Prosthecobacter sp.]
MRIPIRSAFCLLLIGTSMMEAVAQSTGGPYSISAASLDPAGGRTTGGAYRNDGALGATGSQQASSGSYQAASGYPSMLRDATALLALPGTLAESTATQLTLRHVLDDGTQSVISSTGASWSVLNGPLSVNGTGLATAQAIFTDTNATVQVSLGGLTSPTALTIQNSISDNFGIYGSDGIGDDWQVQHFGQNNPQAGPTVDADGDGQNNLFEFTAGVVPTSSTSRFTFSIEGVPGQPGQKRMVFSPALSGRTFTLLKTTALLPPDWQPVAGAVTTGNNGVSTLTDTGASGQRAFYRVQITAP